MAFNIGYPVITDDMLKSSHLLEAEIRKSIQGLNEQVYNAVYQGFETGTAQLPLFKTVYRASYFIASFTFTASVTPLLPTTKDYDDNNLFNTTHAAAFTCPIDGYLKITYVGSTGSSTGHTYLAFKNGVQSRGLWATFQASSRSSDTMTFKVATGDYFELRCNLNVTDTNCTLQFELTVQ